MKKLKVFEAFAGFGGSSFGLKKAGIPHEVVMFSEWDRWAQELFKLNHGNIPLFGEKGDINNGDVLNIPSFDLFTGGFPCQPFSSAGMGKGELDPRGTLFYPILKIVENHRPRHILLENVKGMTHRKHLPTLKKIISSLESLGYSVPDPIVLNSKDFGIPQNRERLWIYAFHGILPVGFSHAPKPVQLNKTFHDFLDPQNGIEVPKEMYLSDRQINILIHKHKMPIVEILEEKESLCLDIYNKKLRKDKVSITLTEPHHNSLRVVELSNNERGFTVRKLTINEHYRLMGFGENQLIHGNQSYQQLCKRAGNGWDINVASLIFKKILGAEF
jgi:DNA (cytosine-5)-methyltransferase 1